MLRPAWLGSSSRSTEGSQIPGKKYSYDAVVIGAGHNGLTAAAYLAGAGLSTLVLERREIVGGCCVTEEIAPGCRASTTSYIASMLRPEVIRDLDLPSFGLRMVPCDPFLQVPFLDGQMIRWWADGERVAEEIKKFSARDAKTFLRVDDQLKKLARYLQPFFLEPPPQVGVPGLAGLLELLRVGKRFRGITVDEIGQFVSFLTGSLGEFLDRNYESDQVKTMFLANNVYGKHGGPYQPGTSLGLLFHLLSGGEHELQGFNGHVIGGMGAISNALAGAAKRRGVEIRTSAGVARVDVRNGRAEGVLLEDGTEIKSRVVLSNADPKRTFLGLVDSNDLPEDFRERIRGIKNGRALRQNKHGSFRRATIQGYPTRNSAAAAVALHARRLTRICGAMLRHCQVRPNSRGVVGGLRRSFQCG